MTTIPGQGREHLTMWELLMTRLGEAVADHRPVDLMEQLANCITCIAADE